MSPQWDEDEGDVAAPGKGKKCSICTKVLQQLKKMVGDDPDEVRGAQGELGGRGGGPVTAAPLTARGWCPQETVKAALRKVCGAMKGLGRVCKAMVKKFGSQIAEALQNDDDPEDVCTNLKFCKGCAAGESPHPAPRILHLPPTPGPAARAPRAQGGRRCGEGGGPKRAAGKFGGGAASAGAGGGGVRGAPSHRRPRFVSSGL